MSIETKERHITIDDIFDTFSGMQLIVINPRYTPSKYAAAFGATSGYFADMMDALTVGDMDYSVVDSLFTGTTWYPYGEGETVQEAIENAIDRINSISPEHKREALALVHNSSSNWKRDSRLPMTPLVLTGEEY